MTKIARDWPKCIAIAPTLTFHCGDGSLGELVKHHNINDAKTQLTYSTWTQETHSVDLQLNFIVGFFSARNEVNKTASFYLSLREA